MRPVFYALLMFAVLGCATLACAGEAGKKKIVLVAGTRSHGYAGHEFSAGCLLLKKCLDENAPGVQTVVHSGGWPKDAAVFDGADCIVLYMNGGGGHPVNNHLEEFDKLMQQGVGLVCLHYAVEVPKGKPGNYFLDWIGGYFETFWSVNPHWTMTEPTLAADHPVTRGVRPFTINDEWYYHMRFRDGMEGVTPIITATPPEQTRRKEPSERGGNPDVFARAGMPEVQAWARQRPDGGRGFGFTGGHVHWNWAHDDYRKLVLNAILWCARAEVPQQGVESPTPTLEELLANQDYPQPENFNQEKIKQLLADYKKESQQNRKPGDK